MTNFQATPENVASVVNQWLPRYYREHPDPIKALTMRRVRAAGGNCVTKAAVMCVLFENGGVESAFAYDTSPDDKAFKTLHPFKKPFCQPLRHAWTAISSAETGKEIRLEVADKPEVEIRTRALRADSVRLPLDEGLREYFALQYATTPPSVDQLRELVATRLEQEISRGILQLDTEF